MNDNLQHTPYDSTDRATFDLNTHPHYTAQHSSRTMLDHHSGLPSPRSDADFAAQPDMLREISMSSAPTRDGEQEHTSADETRARTRPRKSSPHDQIEPPRNEIGKMICNHPQSGAQCQNFVFERKCDWSYVYGILREKSDWLTDMTGNTWISTTDPTNAWTQRARNFEALRTPAGYCAISAKSTSMARTRVPSIARTHIASVAQDRGLRGRRTSKSI